MMNRNFHKWLQVLNNQKLRENEKVNEKMSVKVNEKNDLTKGEIIHFPFDKWEYGWVEDEK
jgi:hypothetical protein